MKPPVIVDPSFRSMDEIFSPADSGRLHEMVEVVWGRDDPMPVASARAALEDAIAVVTADWRYGELPAARQLQAIIDVSGRFPIGLNYADCQGRGVRVLSAAPGFAESVAEMSLGLALAASREIVVGDRAMRNRDERWQREGALSSFLLYDKPVGFIGFGSIARSLRKLLAPFRCRISAYDPWLGDGYLRSEGVNPVSLEDLMSGSRIVFVLATPSSENRALLSQDVLEMIAPGSVLVLVSRAHVVDWDALTELVERGRFTAAIDVFPVEPLPQDDPVRDAPMTILSAHRAGSPREAKWKLGEMVVDDLEAIVRGLPPRRLQQAIPELIDRVT